MVENINIDVENVNAWCSFGVTLFLISLVLLFIFKWRLQSIQIMQVLTFLLINEILYSAADLIGYIDRTNITLCSISLIGRLAFIVATNFWIIFITRLVYLQALAPGKYLNLVNFVFKNIIFTYIPSLILSIFLLIIVNISTTDSENLCWRIITSKQALDYVIYITTFILPNFIASIILCVYLVLLHRISSLKWTLFLLFPITSLAFSLYYILIKFIQLFNEDLQAQYFNLAMLGQPLMFGIYYIAIYVKQKQKNKLQHISDLTIRGGSDGQSSFIQQV